MVWNGNLFFFLSFFLFVDLDGYTRALSWKNGESQEKEKVPFSPLPSPSVYLLREIRTFLPVRGRPEPAAREEAATTSPNKAHRLRTPPRNAANNRQLPTAKHGEVIYRLAICRNGALFISTSPPEPIWVPRRPGGGGARTCVRPSAELPPVCRVRRRRSGRGCAGGGWRACGGKGEGRVDCGCGVISLEE